MEEPLLRRMFEESGALLKGHFLLSSGLHSDQYLQCALVLADPDKAQILGRALAELVDRRPALVLAPALGGMIIGHEVARALGARFLFTERENGAMALKRGFALNPGDDFILVEDVVTTGKSSREVIAVAEKMGAQPAGALALIDRSEAAPLPVPLKSLLKLVLPTYQPQNCPLCKEDRPLVKPGSRPQPHAHL